MLGGDLLEVEARFFVEGGEVLARTSMCGGGIPADTRFDTELLARLSEDVVGDAAKDFYEAGGYFARDLRTRPVRDTTDPVTRAALDAGPPYPEQSGRAIHAPIQVDGGPPPGWKRVEALDGGDGVASMEVIRRVAPRDER